MPDEKEVLSEDQLNKITQQIEKRLIERYRNKFIGALTGITVVLVILGYLGLDRLQDSISDKVTSKVLTEQFKRELIKSISDSISVASSQILSKIQENKSKSDSVLNEIEMQHRSVVEAATNEFERTIEVLLRVREESAKKLGETKN